MLIYHPEVTRRNNIISRYANYNNAHKLTYSIIMKQIDPTASVQHV